MYKPNTREDLKNLRNIKENGIELLSGGEADCEAGGAARTFRNDFMLSHLVMDALGMK